MVSDSGIIGELSSIKSLHCLPQNQAAPKWIQVSTIQTIAYPDDKYFPCFFMEVYVVVIHKMCLYSR